MNRLLILCLCLAASGPPMPPGAQTSRRPRIRSESPKAMSNTSRLNASFVVVPIETNWMQYSYNVPYFHDANGQLQLITDPMWVWVKRFDPVNHVWTNVWNGPLPASRIIQFKSTAPRGSVPKYEFKASFQNSPN